MFYFSKSKLDIDREIEQQHTIIQNLFDLYMRK